MISISPAIWDLVKWVTTSYNFYSDKLEVITSFLSRKTDSIYYIRIKDIELNQSFVQRLLKIGTIHIYSTDETDPVYIITNIHDSHLVYTKLTELIEKNKQQMRRLEVI